MTGIRTGLARPTGMRTGRATRAARALASATLLLLLGLLAAALGTPVEGDA